MTLNAQILKRQRRKQQDGSCPLNLIQSGNKWFSCFKSWALVSTLQLVKYLILSYNLKELHNPTCQEIPKLLRKSFGKDKMKSVGKEVLVGIHTSLFDRNSKRDGGSWGRGQGAELVFNGHRVSVWEDGIVLGTDGGDGYTTVRMYLMPLTELDT